MSTPRLLSNRYELGDTLGYGGMSEVHSGKDIRLGRDVAVKVLRADLARDPQFQLRFRREAQNAASLNHPAIVAVYDTGETQTDNGPLPYIVMEFVDGRTLRDIVKTEGPLSPKRAMEAMADACAALDFSHRHGIIHRDVKPANIMITRGGAIKVMDFGIARALSDGQAAVTQTAAVIGTAQYLSPEQARGESVDARSDVYASGCVLFELLTGEPPFTGDSPVAVAYQHVREDPKTPSTLNPNIPPSLDGVVLKALSKNPANRYQSAAEMRGDLVRVLTGQRPQAPMVMSEQERTTMLAGGAPTQVVTGRHRPDSLVDDPLAMEDEEAERRRKRKLIAGAVVLGVAVVVLALYLINALSGPAAPSKVTVPTTLVGMTDQAAVQELGGIGLVSAETPIESNDQQKGHVIRTDPTGGTQVDKNSRVNLFVGAGPHKTTVPDLTGKSQADAQAALQQAGLALGTVGSQPTADDNQVGKVLSQSPDTGISVNAGTPVNITLGVPAPKVMVGDYTGQTYDQAAANITGLGLKPAKVLVDSDQPANTVVDQNPKSTQVKPGSTVTLSVSKGPQLQMPNLQEMTQQQAMQTLRNMGWNGTLTTTDVQVSDYSQQGLIQTQSIQPGQTIQKNSAITVGVGKYSLFPTTTSATTTSKGGIFPGAQQGPPAYYAPPQN